MKAHYGHISVLDVVVRLKTALMTDLPVQLVKSQHGHVSKNNLIASQTMRLQAMEAVGEKLDT